MVLLHWPRKLNFPDKEGNQRFPPENMCLLDNLTQLSLNKTFLRHIEYTIQHFEKNTFRLGKLTVDLNLRTDSKIQQDNSNTLKIPGMKKFQLDKRHMKGLKNYTLFLVDMIYSFRRYQQFRFRM